MLQFVITAYDHTDKDALSRRMAARPTHAQGLVKLIDSGNLLSAGAILSDDEKMIGSSVHIQFASQTELNSWLESEPYNTQNVWDKVDVRQVKFFQPVASD